MLARYVGKDDWVRRAPAAEAGRDPADQADEHDQGQAAGPALAEGRPGSGTRTRARAIGSSVTLLLVFGHGHCDRC